MKIKELSKGDRITLPLLVGQVNKGVTQNGASYLSINLQDSTGDIEAKLWDVKIDQEEVVKVGLIIEVEADVLLYRQALQLRVRNVASTDQDQFDLSDFVQASEYDVDFLRIEVGKFKDSIEDEVLKKLVDGAFEFYGDKFYQYPAATRNHHDFVGGLATHVYGMAKLADAMCELYPIYNRDLLMAGVLIHDMGKIDEYTAPVLSQYTALGKLVGHISIMHANLVQIARELDLEDREETLLLRHLVLSHHGQLDYGSPVLPMVKEAEILNFIDNIDARTNMFEKFYEEQEEGTFSPRMFALDNRNFYKGKGVK